MKKSDIEKEHILTRQELHNLMISYNYTRKNKIDEIKLSKAIYKLIDNTYDANKEDLEINLYIQNYCYRKLLVFGLNNGNYIYWMEDENKSEEDNYISKIEFLECILDNYNDSIEDNLIDNLNQAKSDLNFIRKANEYIEVNKNPILNLKKSFKNYDYVKILKNYYFIGYYDIITCKDYLEKSDDSQNDFNLTIDEKVCLCLIILYGLKNIYFYYSKLYKYSLEEYNNCIKNMDIYLNFIEKNKYNVSKEKIYSKENNYYEYIILQNIITQFYLAQDKDYYIIRKYIEGNFLREPLQLIYFDYLINNNKYEEARKYIDTNPIYLYSNIEKIISIEDNKDEIVNLLIRDVVDDYKMKIYDTTFCDTTLNKLLEDNEYKNKYVVPTLRFIINYLYLLKSENKEKEVNCLYSFLKIFEKGFGIEDFIIKFDYEILFSKLKDISKVDEDADIDSIDNVIDEMSNTIDNASLIDKHDIEKVEKIYPHINFKNLNPKVKNYIATGDTIMIIFNDTDNIDFDYSSAVIEWSKAVELETWEKLTNILQNIDKNYKENICNQINPYKYIKRKGKKELTPNEVVNFKFGTNIGTFDAIDIRFMKDGRTMRKYLYDNYYSKFYDLDENTYNQLIDNILLVYNPRNKSAHKDASIQLNEAKVCQNTVLAAKKILEVLSTLKKYDNYK